MVKMSCNGCRVLRKGCSENCVIRPCLEWIRTPESQKHATLFLAKYYGRSAFMRRITAGPDELRPVLFRSLLYEACGRIVNPIYGSLGLLRTGDWSLCEAAVSSVLQGGTTLVAPVSEQNAVTDSRQRSLVNCSGKRRRTSKFTKSQESSVSLESVPLITDRSNSPVDSASISCAHSDGFVSPSLTPVSDSVIDVELRLGLPGIADSV